MLAFLLYSCVKVLDFEIPDDEKKIVINSLFSEGDTLSVYVNKSLHVLDRRGSKFINNAQVKLYYDEDLVAEIVEGKNGYYNLNFVPEIGKEYMIEVSVPGLKTATAKSMIPEPVQIDKVDTVLISSNYMYHWLDALQCEINFSDPPDQDNYYEVVCNISYFTVSETDSLINDTIIIGNTETVPIGSNDPIIEGWITGENYFSNTSDDGYITANSFLFSDKVIDGKRYNFKMRIGFGIDYFADLVKVDVELRSITKDFFLYVELLNNHLDVKKDPLTEPAQAYSNVEDGLGIFSGYSTSVYSILYEPEE